MMNYPSLDHILHAFSPNQKATLGTSDPEPLPPVDQDPAYDPALLSPQATKSSYSTRREVSIVETYSSTERRVVGNGMHDGSVGMDGVLADPHIAHKTKVDPSATTSPTVSFNPPLSLQRIQWALDVLRRERVGSVLDIGCGEGTLLEALCQPASTVLEDPIRPSSTSASDSNHARQSTDDDLDLEGLTDDTDSMDTPRIPTSSPTRAHAAKRHSNASDPGRKIDSGGSNGFAAEEETSRSRDRRESGPEKAYAASGGRSGVGKRTEIGELFLYRIAGLDVDPTVIPRAVAVTAPPTQGNNNSTADHSTSPTSTDQPHGYASKTNGHSAPLSPISTTSVAMDEQSQPKPEIGFPMQYQPTKYVSPRWQRTDVEIWNGGLERHNHRLEGYEAIVALEVIEHLDQPSFDILPQIIFGTYRPPLVLITTPNFEFNSKFPRATGDSDGCDHVDDFPTSAPNGDKAKGVGLGGRGGQWGQRGFLDPTGRTKRVFRHSDHKLEMTEEEFRSWAEAAEEWGYSAEISGIGISNTPSYHDGDPSRPLYATQTAIFRRGGQPTRSPRSVRTAQLPFIGGGEAAHPHKLAARHTHEPRGPGDALRNGRPMHPLPTESIQGIVRDTLTHFNVGTISIAELWAVESVSRACAGSKRTLVSVLGGYSDVVGAGSEGEKEGEFEVFWPDTALGSLSVKWNAFEPARPEEEEPWGTNGESTPREVEMDDASGW